AFDFRYRVAFIRGWALRRAAEGLLRAKLPGRGAIARRRQGLFDMPDAHRFDRPKGLSRRSFLGGSAALATCGATMLGACSSGDPAGDATATGRLSLTFLTILPPQTLTFAPELLADAGGHFADHRLDVKFELTRGSAQAVQLVLAGRAPLTRISQIEGMRAAANRGAPLVNVGMVFKDSTIRYVSSRTEPLLAPEDF